MTLLSKILIIRPDMIGDSMLITPAIRLLREKYKSAKISVLARSYTKYVFANNPDIDEVLEDWFAEGKIKSIKDFMNYIDFIKKQNFDCSIHFYNEMPYALLAFLSGIKCRVGDISKPLIAPLYNLRTNQKWCNLTLHEAEHNILLLKPLGIAPPEIPPPMRLTARKELLEIFERDYKINENDFLIGIHIGIGRTSKAWFPDRYARVIDILHKKHADAKILLTGSSKEKEAARRIFRNCKNKPINLVEKTTLSELIAIISRCNIFISSDTGPLHIASALGVPVAALFPTKFLKPAQWGPWQTDHIIIRKAVRCHQKCRLPDCPFDDCLKEISEEDVIEGVTNLLENKGNKTLKEAKADWLKKSLNVFTNKDEIIRELSLSGYHAVEIGMADNPLTLVNQMIKEDINVIHWVGHTRPWALTLAKYLATPNLPIPPILIYEKSRHDFSVSSLVELYKRRFNQ